MQSPCLDLLWIKSFRAVSQTLSFTRAAGLLDLRQPAVSEHIRKLEAVIGVRLFVRDTHSVRLTPDGEAMVGFANSMLAVNDRAMQHFKRGEISGVIRLGISEDVVLTGLPQLLRSFIADHPRVNLELTVEISAMLRRRFINGELDLALFKQPVGEGSGEILWTDRLVWIAASGFVLDPTIPVPLIMLSAPALTRSVALAALENAGRNWQSVCTSYSQAGIHAATLAGLGVAPHALSLIPEGLVMLEHRLLPPLGQVEFVMLSARKSNMRAARALSELIMVKVEELSLIPKLARLSR